MHSQNDASIAAIVLAAGKGTRMKSDLPKVLHKICGLPMVGHVIRTLEKASINEKNIVVGGDVDLHDVMIAGEKASVAMQLTLQVRNKLVEAYQDVMRMQV